MGYFVAYHPLIAAQVTYCGSVEPCRSFPDPDGLPDYAVRRSESQPALRGGQHPKTIDMYSKSLNKKTSMLSIEIILLNVPSGGSLERSRPTDICLSMCVRVRVSVCPSILVSVARRAGPIRNGEEDRPDKRSS